MELTREEALRLHRQMWSDMQRMCGDSPSFAKRVWFKEKWCREHGYDVQSNCFLCEYDRIKSDRKSPLCECCPIDWGRNSRGEIDCSDNYKGVSFEESPISDILALPERKNV